MGACTHATFCPSLAHHSHSKHQLIAQNLAALADHVQRSSILDDGGTLESWISRVVVVGVSVVLHPPSDREVVQDGAGVDHSPGAAVVAPQRLEDRELPLHDAEDVLGAHCPQSGEPGVELCLPGVQQSISVRVGLDEHIGARITRVAGDEELPLALNRPLHHRVLPDAGVVVRSLPVGDDVEDEVLIIAQNLDVEAVAEFSVEIILANSPNRNPPRLLLELHQNTVDTGKEPGQTKPHVVPLCSRPHLFVAGQLDHIGFNQCCGTKMFFCLIRIRLCR